MTKKTLVLFFSALFLSLTSLYTVKKGYGEIYPFFSWRLFTKPSGFSKTDVQYKLYGIRGNDTLRLANTASKLFDENERASLINGFGDKISKNIKRNLYKKRLLDLAKIVEPNFQNFILVKETFNAQQIDQKSFKIQKEFITQLK